jgi:hypothetical protein
LLTNPAKDVFPAGGARDEMKNKNPLTGENAFYHNEVEIMRIPIARDLHRQTCRLAFVLTPGL